MKNSVSFIALDLETATSFRGSICEIGLAFVENGEIVKSQSWLIQPKNNEYDSFNTYIHGITPEMTLSSPSFKEVWPEIQRIIENRTIVCHNTAFDMYALADALREANLKLPSLDYFCSLRLARKAFPGLISYSLPSLCDDLNIDFDTHHRAEFDAKGCAEIFLRILSKFQIDNLNELPQKLNFNKGGFEDDNHFPQRQKSALNKGTIQNILKDIHPDESLLDESNYFYGKEVCFTGTFNFGVRRNLLQAIAHIGGIPTNSVTKTTNVLVIGQQDFKKVGAEGMSSKQRKAMKLIKNGQDLEIMSEMDFLTNFGGEIPLS